MKAISLWQPWASAVALGLKRIETRHWFTAYRGPIAIHAAKRWTRDERELHAEEVAAGHMPAELPFGALVAVARLTAIRPTDQLAAEVTSDEYCWGNYAPGRFGWLLEDIQALPTPVQFRGLQGIFEVPNELLHVTIVAAQGSLFGAAQ